MNAYRALLGGGIAVGWIVLVVFMGMSHTTYSSSLIEQVSISPVTTVTGTSVPYTTAVAQSDPLTPLPTFTFPPYTPTPIPLEGETTVTFADENAEIAWRLARMTEVYLQQPLTLFYQSSVILAIPADIGFRFDEEAQRDALRITLDNPNWLTATTLNIKEDSEILQSYVQDIALRYDTPVDESSVDLSTLATTGGEVFRLDIPNTLNAIRIVVRQPTSRNITLPLIKVESARLTLTDLQDQLLRFFRAMGIPYASPNSVISVYVKNLETGEVLNLYGNTPHSATSTIKVAILANYFRFHAGDVPDDERFHIAASIICSQNSDANLLLELADDGVPLNGLNRVNETLCEIGAGNTFMLSKLYIGEEGRGGVPSNYYAAIDRMACPTAAPADTNLFTNPDPILQTTAAEMGTLMEQIYTCATAGTGLASLYPDEITQTECQWMLEVLSGARFMRLAELGLPEGTRFAHKIGYGGEGVADVGIVYSPNATYVLAIYVWDDQLDNYGSYLLTRWNIVADISRLVYNYFNPDQPLTQPRIPPNPIGGVGCVLPQDPSQISFSDINQGRFDSQGIPLVTACYDYPTCREFTGWESP